MLALVASWALLLPFFQKQALGVRDTVEVERAREVSQKKEIALTALEDLEQDYLLHRVTEDGYQKTRAELMADAAVCVAELDGLKKAGK